MAGPKPAALPLGHTPLMVSLPLVLPKIFLTVKNFHCPFQKCSFGERQKMELHFFEGPTMYFLKGSSPIFNWREEVISESI